MRYKFCVAKTTDAFTEEACNDINDGPVLEVVMKQV